MKFKPAKRQLLAWMQPDGNRRQQILSVALVPLQPGIPIGLYGQIMAQQPSKLYRLLKKSQEEYPEGRADLAARLEGLGLLPYEATPELSDWDFVNQVMEGEIMMYLSIRPPKGEKEPTEIPGARELYEELTLEEWMNALDAEVSGR